MSARKVFRNFFADFDMFKADPTLRVDEEPFVTNFCTGIFSFLVFGFFTYIFVSGMVAVFNYDKISSVGTQSFVPVNEASADKIFFAVNVNFLSIEQMAEKFEITLNITYLSGSQETKKMQPCKLEQWSLMANAGNYFNESRLEDFLCPVTRQGLDLKKTWLVEKPQFIQIILAPCTSSPSCASAADQRSYIQQEITDYGEVQFFVYFLDQSLAPQKEEPIEWGLNVDPIFSFSMHSGFTGKIYVGSYQVTTDVGLMPVEEKVTKKGNFLADYTMVSVFRESTSDTDIYGRVTFYMSPKLVILDRKVGKIDEMLSYAGGLFSIIGSFLAWFLMSFNEYRYELRVAEKMFAVDQEGRRVKENHMHFPMYVVYSVFDWVDTLFCFQLGCQSLRRMHHARVEATKQMDIGFLFKKIQHLESITQHLMTPELKDIFALSEPLFIKNIQRSRGVIEYYDQVMKRVPGVTLRDLNIAKSVADFSLQNSPIINNENSQNNMLQQPSRINEIILQSSQDSSFLECLKKAQQQFPELYMQATSLELDEEFIQVQQHLKKSFKSLKQEELFKFGFKIPLKILFRISRTEESNHAR